MTGFPGFVSSHLLERLAASAHMAHFVLLILPHERERALARLHTLQAQQPALKGKWELLEGDITKPRLGLTSARFDELRTHTHIVWHLAALYDLAVPQQLAYQVNLQGTSNVLDFCAACAHFERLNYVSTCYVSGDRTGTIYEHELDLRQGHKNHYESTKFWAEVEVQRRAAEIPSVIYRPGVIVGDSRTGQTDKYDGPYSIFQLLDRLPAWMPLPNVGSGESSVNLVPIDFAAAAMVHISAQEEATGRVFQIADPNPMRARDILALTLKLLGRPAPRGLLPASLAERALKFGRVERALGVPRESLIYFNHDARYDTSHTQAALRQTPIRCPHLSTYLLTLLDYMHRHPGKHSPDDGLHHAS